MRGLAAAILAGVLASVIVPCAARKPATTQTKAERAAALAKERTERKKRKVAADRERKAKANAKRRIKKKLGNHRTTISVDVRPMITLLEVMEGDQGGTTIELVTQLADGRLVKPREIVEVPRPACEQETRRYRIGIPSRFIALRTLTAFMDEPCHFWTKPMFLAIEQAGIVSRQQTTLDASYLAQPQGAFAARHNAPRSPRRRPWAF